MSNIDLTEARVVDTGAAGGIGVTLCSGLLQCGAHIMSSDLKLSEVLQELIQLYPNQIRFESCDLMQDQQVEELLEKACQWNCNVLVNNAAIFDMSPFWESGLDQYDRLFQINVRAMFRMMQGVSNALRQRGQRGKIINFSSQAGRPGEALVSHYCATRAAVISYTQPAALALAPYQTNVNAIAPGVVDTPMWNSVDVLFVKYEHLQPGEKKQQVGKAVPLGSMGKPQDIVGAVLFLASDLSDYITGQTLNVDGGNVLN
jgi:D-sorbitol dehydrogenase (acceptor)